MKPSSKANSSRVAPRVVTEQRSAPNPHPAIEDAVLASADAATARAEASSAAEWETAAGVALEAAKYAAANAAQRDLAADKAEGAATAQAGTEAAESCPIAESTEATSADVEQRTARPQMSRHTAVVMAATSAGPDLDPAAIASTAQQARTVSQAIVDDEMTGELAAIATAYAAAAAASYYGTRTGGVDQADIDAASAAAHARAAAAAGLAIDHIRSTGSRSTPVTTSPSAAPAITAPSGDPLVVLCQALANVPQDARSEWGAALSELVAQPLPQGDDLHLPAPVPGVSALMRDLTIARRMEALLSETYDGLQLAFDAAPVALMVTELAAGHPSRFRHVNRALCTLTGYSRTELLDADPCDLLHPEAHGEDYLPLRRLAGPGTDGRETDGYDEVRRWLHADGRDIVVRVQLSTAVDSAAGRRYLIGQVEDVTRRNAAEAALRQSEHRFRLAFRAALSAQLMLDIKGPSLGRLLAVNAAAVRLTGRTESEMLSLSMADLHHVRDRAGIQSELLRLINGDASQQRLVRYYRHVEGREVAGRYTATLVRDDLGGPQYVLAQVEPLDVVPD